MEFSSDPEFVARLDAEDPLRSFRDEFWIPQREARPETYLVGNSLGLQPRRTQDLVDRELQTWREIGVRGHFEGSHPWMPYHEFLTDGMARLVGCYGSEVVVMNSLTANLHLLMASFYQPRAGKAGILIEDHAFPSDHYAAESQIRFHGFDPEQWLYLLRPRQGQVVLRTGDILEKIDELRESLALVMLPGVQYYTGQCLDMRAICEHCRNLGIHVGLDLAHAVGNVALDLHEWGPDFAVWCTYKYLNSGPGSVGACFVHERHHAQPDLPKLTGWWGHEPTTRFQMSNQFDPSPSVESWQLSNPPILSLAAIRASLEVFGEAGGMEPLLAKSRQLTKYLAWLIQHKLAGKVEILTPLDDGAHGCQLSLRICDDRVSGRDIHQRLEQAGVMTDWREPDVIRAAPVPLYNRYADVHQFVQLFARELDG